MGMWYATHKVVNIAVIAFIVMAGVSGWFAAATVAHEMGFQLPALTRRGDSSLSPQSVNWLAVTALIGAVLICLV
jgi:hypothetical protein